MTTQAKRVLPADVFDALELSALIHGGIGAGCLARVINTGDDEHVDYDEVPHCVVGHAMFLDGYVLGEQGERDIIPNQSPVMDALVAAFPDLGCDPNDGYTYSFNYRDFIDDIESENDRKVSAALIDAGKAADIAIKRITFKKWCKKLRVVRGEN